MHLDGAQGQIMRKAVSRRDEFGALLNDSSAGSLVSLRDDNSKVFRPEKGWHTSFNSIKAFFKPLRRFREIGKNVQFTEVYVNHA